MAQDEKRITIGDRIRSRRGQVGMTHREIAEAMGVSRMSVSLWERGETALSAENLIKLAEILQCNPVWIMTGLDNPYSNVPPAVIDTEDMIILSLIKLLPSIEKERITNELREKVTYYDELYNELKSARQGQES